MTADRTFFVAEDASGRGTAIWVTDGTAAGTRELQVTDASFTGLNPDNLTISASGTLFFNGFDSPGKSNLWVSDGTAAGTTHLAVPGAPSSFYVSELTPFDGKLYFSGETSTVNTGLWVWDGTAAGTQELQVPGASSFGLTPRSIVSIGSKLVLNGTNASGAEGLWVSYRRARMLTRR